MNHMVLLHLWTHTDQHIQTPVLLPLDELIPLPPWWSKSCFIHEHTWSHPNSCSTTTVWTHPTYTLVEYVLLHPWTHMNSSKLLFIDPRWNPYSSLLEWFQVDLTKVLAERVPTDQVDSKTPPSPQNWVLTATKGKRNSNYYTGDSLGQLSCYSRDGTWKQLKVNPVEGWFVCVCCFLTDVVLGDSGHLTWGFILWIWLEKGLTCICVRGVLKYAFAYDRVIVPRTLNPVTN